MSRRGGGTGRGRAKGTPNLRTQRLGKILDRLVPDEELIRLLWRLARQGDGRCATYLADRKWGRVKFELEHQGPQAIFITMGNGSDLEYEPMGVVPGMEPFMPSNTEVRCLTEGQRRSGSSSSDSESSGPA